MSPENTEQTYSLREQIEIAHRAVQAAQEKAYRSTLDGRPEARFRTRVALNRAQALLIRLVKRSSL